MPSSCAWTQAWISGIFVIVRNYPASLGDPQRKAASGRAMDPQDDARAVAVVVCEGVTAFELGVACDVFGSEWAATLGVPWYRSFVCGITPATASRTSGLPVLAGHA